MLRRLLADHLLPDAPALAPGERAEVAAAAEAGMARFFAQAPAYLRLALAAGDALIAPWLLAAAVSGGSARRRARIAAALACFERLPGPPATILRLYRSLALMAFFEHPLVEARLGLEAPGARMARFRALRRVTQAGEARP